MESPVDASNPMAPGAAAAQPVRMLDRRQCLARVLPECLSLACALAIGFGLPTPGLAEPPQVLLHWVVMVEGATLMFLCTVVDIATRLRRAPPWWAGLALAGALLVLYPEVPGLVLATLQEGLWIALPFAWSVLERLRELWTLPRQSRLEKLRRRALTFGRLHSGLLVAGGLLLADLAWTLLGDGAHEFAQLTNALAPWAVSLFFALCAWDAVRVHRPAFAERPIGLWPSLDGGQTAYLDPL